jgi:transposase
MKAQAMLRYFYCQDSALYSENVIAFPEHLLREVLGRLVIIRDGSIIHRSHVVKEFLERVMHFAPSARRSVSA